MTDKTVLINGIIVDGTGNSTWQGLGGLAMENGVVSSVFPMEKYKACSFPDSEIVDVHGLTVCPGLVDTHIHGIGGFGTEDGLEHSVLGMSKTLADFGVTSFLPTLYPDSREILFKQEEAICSAMGKEEGARILGINVEGPFISSQKSGALPKDSIGAIDLDYFEEIISHGHGNVVCMTVAPEHEHIEEFARVAKDRKIVLLAGHTNGTYEDIIRGADNGILHSTHFFNAMSPLNHRKPGAVGAILSRPDMSLEIIADGVHVHPELVKLVVSVKGTDKVAVITDSLKPNGQKAGKLYANGVEVVLSDKGAFVSAENPELLNGSALTLNRGVLNMKNWGIPVADAVKMASKTPAFIYGFDKIGTLSAGKCADIAVFDENFIAKAVFVNGKIIRSTL